jgi:hypothetical protein
MAKKNFCYRNVNVFKDVLINRLKTEGIIEELNCDDAEKWIHPRSLLNKIISIVWTVVNTGCVISALKEWKLLDTAKLAGQIGQIPLFCWVKKQSLGHWIVGLVLTGFSLQVVEAGLKLILPSQNPLKKEEKQEAYWSVYSSLGETILFGSIFLNMIGQTQIEKRTIDYFRIGAKLVGIYKILSTPPRQYFQAAEEKK